MNEMKAKCEKPKIVLFYPDGTEIEWTESSLWRDGYNEGIKEKEDQFIREHYRVYSCLTKKQIKDIESKSRKQTLTEVLKMADKFNIFEESDTGAIKFIEWLEQKLKELSK